MGGTASAATKTKIALRQDGDRWGSPFGRLPNDPHPEARIARHSPKAIRRQLTSVEHLSMAPRPMLA